jgi:hypothetical protein
MDTIKTTVNAFDANVDKILSTYMVKPTLIRGVVHLLLMLYVARIAPTPPKVVLDLFSNVYFKLFIFSLVLWTAQFSPSTSILIALAFLVTINYSTTGKLWEMLDNIAGPGTPVSVVVVTPIQSIQAVDLLAKAASTSVPSDPAAVQSVANVAAVNISTPTAASALKALADQAVTPTAGTDENIQVAVAAAKSDIEADGKVSNTPIVPDELNQESGCYPARRYDASAAIGVQNDSFGFDNYAFFVSGKK